MTNHGFPVCTITGADGRSCRGRESHAGPGERYSFYAPLPGWRLVLSFEMGADWRRCVTWHFFLCAAYDSVEPQPGGCSAPQFCCRVAALARRGRNCFSLVPKMQSCSCSDPSPRRRHRADESAGEPAESASCTAAFHLDHGDQCSRGRAGGGRGSSTGQVARPPFARSR